MRKITYWLSLVLIFIVPWEDSLTVTTLGSLAKVIGVVVAGFWIVTMLVEGRFRKPHLFHVFVLLFFLWNAVSLFWSPSIDDTIQRIKTYAQIFLLMLIFWDMFQKSDELMAGLQAYIFGAYVLIGSSLLNYVHGTEAVAYEGRYSATGVNAVDLALILMLGLPIALQLFFVGGRGIKILKLVNLAFIPLAIFSIILTGSRTSLIAIAPFAVYALMTKQIESSKRLLILAILLVSGLALLPFVPQSVISRLGTLGSSIEEGDLGGRVGLWWQAILALGRNPLLGVGGGVIDSIIGSAAHNTFVSIVAETGFVGFVLFFSIMLIVFYQAMQLPNGDAGLWVAVFLTWAIGVCSLSWEFRKLTWLILSFIIIEGSVRDEKPLAVQPDLSLPPAADRIPPTRETGVGAEAG